MKIVIAGAGISGLAIAHALRQARPDIDLTIVESADRCGGKAWTDVSKEGYRCEWGVNGFLDNKDETLALCSQLGLSPLPADKQASERFVFRGGDLHRLPESPPAFLLSRLMSLRGRLRVMAEVLVPQGDASGESLQEFATRRLGREGFEALIDPMASGVFAGDPARMSLASCFPRIHELEQQYGGLIRGMIRLQREARRRGKSKRPGAGPGGTLTSFAGGISDLIDRLSLELAGCIRTGDGIVAVERQGLRYVLQLGSGRTLEADQVVLAIPSWVQAQVLREYSPEAAGLLEAIAYPPLTVICLGYKTSALSTNPPGFGFLVPGTERRGILGAVVDSNVFPGRAPEGRVLLRVMAGGERFARYARLPDAALLAQVYSELSDILDIHAEPEFVRIYRHERAIPQYHVGHGQRLEEIGRVLAPGTGLVLAGNAFRGVSLNDCVSNGFRQAKAVLRGAGMLPLEGNAKLN